MGPPRVVIGHPPVQSGPEVRSRFKGVEIDAFVLHGSPEPFDEDVVHPSAPPIHADLDLGVQQDTGEPGAGKLTALIGVEDLWFPEAVQGLFQGLDTEVRLHGVGQPPGQHFPSRPVHDRHEIQETPPHRNVGDVGAPDMIGSGNLQILQQVGIGRMVRMGITGPRLLVNGRQPHLRHQV